MRGAGVDVGTVPVRGQRWHRRRMAVACILAFLAVEVGTVWATGVYLIGSEDEHGLSSAALLRLSRAEQAALGQPDNVEAQKAYADMLLSLGFRAEASALAEQVHARLPQDRLGQTLRRQTTEQLLAVTAQYPSSVPVTPGFHYDQARRYLVLGERAKAAASLRSALSSATGKEEWLQAARRTLSSLASRAP